PLPGVSRAEQRSQNRGGSSGIAMVVLSGERAESNGPGDRLQPLPDLLGLGPGHLPDDPAVAQEHQVRPDLDPKRAAERFPGAVLDPEAPNLRELLEEGRQLRLQRPAEP